MPCQTDKLVPGFSDENLKPLATSSSGGRGPRCGEAHSRRGGGIKVVPVHRAVPLAASESPGPACVLPPASGASSAAARCTDTREAGLAVWTGVRKRRRRRWEGRGAAAAAAHQQRQADNKTRQNAAHQTGWLHGGDRSPYFGSALTLCCILPL